MVLAFRLVIELPVGRSADGEDSLFRYLNCEFFVEHRPIIQLMNRIWRNRLRIGQVPVDCFLSVARRTTQAGSAGRSSFSAAI